MTAVDWSRWRKCPVCFAETGEPCRRRSGWTRTTNGGYAPRSIVELDQPHSTRKPRAGGEP